MANDFPLLTRISNLRAEAAAAGDLARVRICDLALEGDDLDAMDACAQMLVEHDEEVTL